MDMYDMCPCETGIMQKYKPLRLCCDNGITFSPWKDFKELAGTSICWEPCCTTV